MARDRTNGHGVTVGKPRSGHAVGLLTSSEGAFVLANDRHVGWLIAFLESFREFDTDTPLLVLPYDDSVEQVLELRGVYDFDLWHDGSFAVLEAIGRRLMPAAHQPGMFRKLACFWGPFERFLYIDADTLLMVDAHRLIQTLDTPGAAFTYLMKTQVDAVYRPGPLRTAATAEGSHMINTGTWASEHGLFDLEGFKQLAGEASSVKTEFADVGEQPFLNYCLAQRHVAVAPFPNHTALTQGIWPGNQGSQLVVGWNNGRPVVRDPGTSEHVGVIHWAGYTAGPAMPYRRLWSWYRFRRSPAVIRWAHLLLDPVSGPLIRWSRGLHLGRRLGRLARLGR